LPGKDICPRCDLPRAEFFDECQRIESDRKAIKAFGQGRNVLQSCVLLVFGTGFGILALRSHLNRDFADRNVALVIVAIFAVAWIFIIYVSCDTLFPNATRQPPGHEASEQQTDRRDV
jgi:hypothetical protein